MTNRLTTNKPYVLPGTYLGEDVQPGGVNLTAQNRVPTYVGKGSRYIHSRNDGITRGYINGVELVFSKSSPFTAPLAISTDGIKDVAVLVDSHGTEVRRDQWTFTPELDAVIIADAAYVQGETYTISYQGSDSSVGDSLVTADIRLVKAIGSQIDQDQYKRNIDYYVETATLPAAAAVDETGSIISQANQVSSISAVAKTAGAGTGTVELDPYAAFDHIYTRAYALEVVAVSGSEATFAWTATPLSAGNMAAVAVPASKSIPAPEFVVDSTNPQTQNVALEFSLRLNFNGTFVVGDKFSFTAYGPSLLEVDATISNTNQFPEASGVTPDLDNAGIGSLSATAEDYVGSTNLTVRAQVINVDNGAVSATLPTATVEFTAIPADATGLQIDNGRTGITRAVRAFEFDTDGIQSILGSTLVAKPVSSATAASGTVEFIGAVSEAPADGTIVTVSDGVRTVTFEFDNDAQLAVPGTVRVLIDGTPGSQSANTAANLATAINASALRITASNISAGNGNVGKVSLVAQVAGSVANVAIVVDSSNAAITGAQVVAVGLAGGADAAVNLAGTITNFIAAVNNADLGIYAELDESNTSRVKLTHGARLVFTAQPADADTFTVNVGSGATVFEFDNNAAVGGSNVSITIGGSLSATLGAVKTAIEAQLDAKVLVLSDRVLVIPSVGRNVTIVESGTNTSVLPSVVDDVASLNNGNSAILPLGGISGVSIVGFAGGTDATTSPDRVTVAWGTAGDAFASGASVLTDGSISDIYRGIKIKLSTSAAAPAKASIQLTANPVDTNSVTITDGIVGSAVTFEFDSNASATPGNTSVVIGATAAASAANLASAINASVLQISVELIGTTIKLTHKKNGPGPAGVYNTPITKTGTAITVIGFAGGKSNYSVGDKFSFNVKAARTFTTALDDRITTLTVQKVGINDLDNVDPEFLRIVYASNTAEGGFGLVETDSSENGYFTLPGQIRLAARNTASANRFAVGDKFTVQHVNNQKLFWNLDAKSTEAFTINDVLTDRNGSVTGTFGSYYVALANTPYASTVVVKVGGVATTAFRLIPGTSFIELYASDLTVYAAGISVSYVHTGNEPAIGSSYYITGYYKRPKGFYNVPRLLFDPAQAKEFLAPVTADNDLAIMSEIAFAQANAPIAIATVQVEDADDDGVFSPADVDAALASCEEVYFITDLTPVRLHSFISKFLAFNVKACDPFAKREHSQYFGVPAGTPIGDASTPGSIVFLAKNTLQIYGKSFAHGTRVVAAPRVARKTMTMTDDTVSTVTLDGSFVAGAIAACVAGLPNYSVTLLKSRLYGFDYIETFGASVNERLGAAGVIFFSDAGSGVYVFEEDQTVDNYSSEFHEILPMRTKQDVTRIVRRELDESVVGMVPNTRGDATATIAARIMQVLIGLVNRGITAPYQDDNGNARQINSGDVQVFVDENDPTLYNFYYTYYTRFAVKRLFGLYSVNKTIAQ